MVEYDAVVIVQAVLHIRKADIIGSSGHIFSPILLFRGNILFRLKYEALIIMGTNTHAQITKVVMDLLPGLYQHQIGTESDTTEAT